MTAIWIISCIHGLWGASILIMGYVPRPFGSLEPYLRFLDVRDLGLVLLASSVMPAIGRYLAARSRPVYFPLAVVPQQLLITWGAAWAIVLMTMEGGDARTWLGFCYQAVLAVFHGIALFGAWKAVVRSTPDGY